jgi:hypothetical protein
VEHVAAEGKLSNNPIADEVFYGSRIPHLIEEVPDFKGFIARCIAEEDEALEGHTKAQQFKFYVDSSGYLVMKYKILCTNNDWLPKEGRGIQFW